MIYYSLHETLGQLRVIRLKYGVDGKLVIGRGKGAPTEITGAYEADDMYAPPLLSPTFVRCYYSVEAK